MRHNERRHTHQHHHAPAPALDNAHGIPQRRQRRVSDVSGLLFASDFPEFGEEPKFGMPTVMRDPGHRCAHTKFGMKPSCTCSQPVRSDA